LSNADITHGRVDQPGELIVDRKVFNNIWGTFTFGPDNTVYIGAYRGFLRFLSDDEMPVAPAD